MLFLNKNQKFNGIAHYVSEENEFVIASSSLGQLYVYDLTNEKPVTIEKNYKIFAIQMKNSLLYGKTDKNKIVILKFESIEESKIVLNTNSTFNISGLDKTFDIYESSLTAFGPCLLNPKLIKSEDRRKKIKIINFHKEKIRAIRSNEKTNKMYSGGWDRNIICSNMFTQKKRFTFKKIHSNFIYDFELTRCKKLLFSGGHDNHIFIIDCFSHSVIKKFNLPYLISNIKTSFNNKNFYAVMWTYEKIIKERIIWK